MSDVIFGSPILIGDNTTPGVKLTPELEEYIPRIIKAVSDFGCDFYAPIVELLTYDEISEVAAYGGFPVRYPHWRFGMEYENLQRGYEHGRQKIYEMVINTNPCYIYCLDSNPLIDHITVVAHALGHSDFFKNNYWFQPTTENAMNELANNGTRIKQYMDKWGNDRVQRFIDCVLSIDDLIDPAKAWRQRHFESSFAKDDRTYHHPRRLKLPETDGQSHEYMENWINDKEWIDNEYDRIENDEIRTELGLFEAEDKDILGYLVNNAPLQPWQQDIIAMLYNEAQYFAPQRVTKMLNEGWASYIDFNIMARRHWAGPAGLSHYCKHKAGVLGGKYSMNPYAIGFNLFLYIEDKWNKGKFGRAYEECQDANQKKNWDLKLGLGHEKVFELRKTHNDITAIHRYIDQEFVDQFEFFLYKKFPLPDGGVEYQIETRDADVIKQTLLKRYMNGGLPIIKLVDPNFAGKGLFLLQHDWIGQTLHPTYTGETLMRLWCIWNNFGVAGKRPVAIASKNKQELEIVYVCTGPEHSDIVALSRKEFEEKFA